MPTPHAKPTRILGRFLRRCRLEARYSLREVAELSSRHPTPLSASLLSRVEQGRHTPHATILLTLSKVYDVPSQRFLEHLELDAYQPSDSDEQDLTRLVELGREQLDLDRPAEAFAVLEKAYGIAKRRLAEEANEDNASLFADVAMRLGGAARRLDLHRVSEVYLKDAIQHPFVPDRIVAYAFYHLSDTYAEIGSLHLARALADAASTLASRTGQSYLAASSQALRAAVEVNAQRPREARDLNRRCLEQLLDQNQPLAEAIARANMAFCEVLMARDAGDESAARSAVGMQKELLQQRPLLDYPRVAARVQYFLGLSLYRLATAPAIEPADHLKKAKSTLRVAAREAKSYGLRQLEFHARFYLWRAATESGTDAERQRHFAVMKRLRNQVQAVTRETVRFDQEYLRRKSDG